jgi:hypothetical protein
MANADSKAFDDAHPSRSVTIQQSPRWRPYSPRRRPAPPHVLYCNAPLRYKSIPRPYSRSRTLPKVLLGNHR